MGRFAQLNINKGPTAQEGQRRPLLKWLLAQERMKGGGKKGKERLFVIKFSLPEVSDTEAFSGCWNHSPATPCLIG